MIEIAPKLIETKEYKNCYLYSSKKRLDGARFYERKGTVTIYRYSDKAVFAKFQEIGKTVSLQISDCEGDVRNQMLWFKERNVDKALYILSEDYRQKIMIKVEEIKEMFDA